MCFECNIQTFCIGESPFTVTSLMRLRKAEDSIACGITSPNPTPSEINESCSSYPSASTAETNGKPRCRNADSNDLYSLICQVAVERSLIRWTSGRSGRAGCQLIGESINQFRKTKEIHV